MFSLDGPRSEQDLNEMPPKRIAGQGVYHKPQLSEIICVAPASEDSDDMEFEDLSLAQKARRWIAEERSKDAERLEYQSSR